MTRVTNFLVGCLAVVTTPIWLPLLFVGSLVVVALILLTAFGRDVRAFVAMIADEVRS